MTRISFASSALRATRWYELVVRFVFGGAVCAAAGAIGHRYGPLVGGLFLAFPALLPASLTLVYRQEGRAKAADEAAGAVCGAIGLVGFAGVVWLATEKLHLAIVLSLATAVWFGLSWMVWRGLERLTQK